ncbi:MAG: D-amino acid dehydrogenase [Rhizobiales bacterium]|nr:D-amino acid dehydrogenase [Hyphomicrobiales bacterium]
MKVAVIGAGIVGVTTAYQLLRDGHEVTVIDRQPGAGLECSHANGGYVAISQAVPWSQPGVPTKTLLGMLGKAPPILLHPRQVPAMWRWGLEFLLASRAAPSWENTKDVLRLALYSHTVLKETRERETIDYAPILKGTLKVFSEQETMDAAIAVSQAQVPLGLTYEAMSTSQCVAMVPALEPRRGQLAGGICYPDEESGDCFAFTNEMTRICMERGVRFSFDTVVRRLVRDGTRLSHLETSKGDIAADAFVLAAGAESPLLARELGMRLPVLPVKGYSLTFPRSLWPEAPDRPVLDEKRKFGFAPLGTDRLRMSGFAEIAGYDTSPEAHRTEALARSFMGLFPQLETRIKLAELRPFCCLRPVTPKGPPLIGRSAIQNLYFNVGQGHLGWTLAHGSARLVADAIAGRPSEIDLRGYTPASAL